MQKKPIYSPDRAKVTRQPKARKIGVNMSSDAKKRPLSKEGWWHAISTMLPCHYKDPKLGTIVVHLCTILGTSLLRDHFSWAAPGNSLQSTIVKLLLPRSGLFCAGPRLPVDPEAPMGGHGGLLEANGSMKVEEEEEEASARKQHQTVPGRQHGTAQRRQDSSPLFLIPWTWWHATKDKESCKDVQILSIDKPLKVRRCFKWRYFIGFIRGVLVGVFCVSCLLSFSRTFWLATCLNISISILNFDW